MITRHPNKFGFYRVGEFQTYSKIEAIELSKRLKQESTWHFNEDVFDQIDWKIEPALDLWELYKQRARQIRESYDYVVLSYSGGSDSHNILQAWQAADCKIDEILTTWNYEGSKDRQSFYNAEITNVVLPDIESMKNRGLDFKFRLVDISQYSLDVVNEFGVDYKYLVNNNIAVNNPSRTILRKKIMDYQKIIDSGRTLCFVWGIEKPLLNVINKKFICRFIDLMDNNVNPFVINHFNKGWYDELFYWTPDLPQLPIKAAHILKKFLKSCHLDKFYQEKFNPHGYNPNLNKYITFNAANLVLYPKWKLDTFSSGKSSSMIFSERDTWFLKSNVNELKKFHGIVNDITETIGDEWMNGRSLRSHLGKVYYLE